MPLKDDLVDFWISVTLSKSQSAVVARVEIRPVVNGEGRRRQMLSTYP